MIGLVFVTHGNLAREFVAAMEHVVGPQEKVECVCIGPDDNMDERRQEILLKAKNMDTGDGVLLLTDMFGGTPSNLAMSVIGHGHFCCCFCCKQINCRRSLCQRDSSPLYARTGDGSIWKTRRSFLLTFHP